MQRINSVAVLHPSESCCHWDIFIRGCRLGRSECRTVQSRPNEVVNKCFYSTKYESCGQEVKKNPNFMVNIYTKNSNYKSTNNQSRPQAGVSSSDHKLPLALQRQLQKHTYKLAHNLKANEIIETIK